MNLTYKFVDFNKQNLISILGVLEKYGWNVFLRGTNECFILKDVPKDFQDLFTKDYVCLKIISENLIKAGVHLKDKKVNFLDDFCQKKLLITDSEIKILSNEREINFKNFSENKFEEVQDFRYKRRNLE